MSEEYLTLKWGTLKSWNFTRDETQALMKRYVDLGASYSAMSQHDTQEQKSIICELIDLMPGEIELEWDGKAVSKAEAKEYVLSYGKERST